MPNEGLKDRYVDELKDPESALARIDIGENWNFCAASDRRLRKWLSK